MRRLLVVLAAFVLVGVFAPVAFAGGVATPTSHAVVSTSTIPVTAGAISTSTNGNVIDVFSNSAEQIWPGDGDSGCNVYTAGTLSYWSGHQWVCSWVDSYGAYIWVPIS